MKRFWIVLLCLLLSAGTAMAELETTAKVRLRTGPDTSYRAITTVPEGTVLTDLDSIMYDAQERPWYWVEWNGQECWVCGDYAIMTGEQESGASPGESLAESRWVSVSLLGADGAQAYPSGFGGSELWLFPDGTAHWLVYNGDGLLSRDPVGHWQKTGDASLVFYQTESLAAAEEWAVQRFEVTDEGLCTPWDDELTLHLTAYDVLDRWLPSSRDRLIGDWVMYAGETEGWQYMAEEEGVDATLRFTEAPNGNLYYDYRRNGAVQTGVAQYNLNGEAGASDLMTAWAPWYLCIDLQGNERTCAFLANDALLRVESFYYLDGTPCLSTQDYIRKN